MSKFKAEEFKEAGGLQNEFQTLNEIDKTNNTDDKWVRVAWQNDKVYLMPGDSIIVKEAPGTINVTGEVYNPGLIEYQKGKSLGYYIDSAGGVNNNGDKSKIIVIYANGVVEPKKFMRSPKIRNGATIIVNQKEESNRFNVMELATNTLSIISTTVTILVLSQQIGTN